MTTDVAYLINRCLQTGRGHSCRISSEAITRCKLGLKDKMEDRKQNHQVDKQADTQGKGRAMLSGNK